MKRLLTAFIAVLLCLSVSCTLTACEKTADLGVVELNYYDETDADLDYNRNLFYRNDLLETGADPDCILVTEGEYAGWFFLYATSDAIGSKGFECWKSRDLISWEFVSVCFLPEQSSWGRTSLWAPGVIYDEEEGTYVLFYSASNSNQAAGYISMKYIGMAYSDSPAGPFVQYTGTNLDGTVIGIGDPLIDLERMNHSDENYREGTSFIDASPFVDPVSGEKYLYVCRSRNAHSTNVIAVFHMKDWATPDYDSYTILTEVNYTQVGGLERTELAEGVINEAPQMMYYNGTYYLTFSINETTSRNYGVVQALGDSPTGPFTKIQHSDGGSVLYVEDVWTHVTCCGSHSFVYDGEDLWIVYHQDRDREGASGSFNRAFAADRVEFVTNGKGQTLLKAMGPTWSVQPLPSSYTGYSNMAVAADVTATNVAEGSDASLLNDGLILFHEQDCYGEFYGTGTVTITLTFDDYITARELLIYNSCVYEYAFYQVARIDFSFRKKIDGVNCTGIARVENLYYDFSSYSQIEYEIMHPGAPLIIEFDELEIDKITITIACPAGSEYLAISEIMVMGKECD